MNRQINIINLFHNNKLRLLKSINYSFKTSSSIKYENRNLKIQQISEQTEQSETSEQIETHRK